MMKRKTASIVTMHFPCNYGAVLQAYGLSHYLQSEGMDVSTVDYVPEYYRAELSLWYAPNKRCRRNPLLRLGYYMLRVPLRIRQRKAFAAFRAHELRLTEPMTQDDLLEKKNVRSDFYFCGSDQIWNEKNATLSDPVYFLQFAAEGGKRVSYAASGSISFPVSDKVKSTVLPWLRGFDALSVREDTLRDNLQAALGRDVAHVCDPVFLLSREEWERLAAKDTEKKPGGRYVLVYAIGDDPTPYKRARALGDKLGLPVYSMGLVRRAGVDKNLNCSPYHFLTMFAGAECVVTNSFHGFSFALIFNRPFWLCDTSIANRRLHSLLAKTGTEKRLLGKGDDWPDDEKIDWRSVNEKLRGFVAASKDFIKHSTDQ